MAKALNSHHRLLLAIVGAVVAGLLALLVAALVAGGAGDEHHDTSAERRASARGYTDKVTVPLYAPKHFRPSVPRPDVLPPMIRSSGECKVAMDAVRDFQDENPSGLVLSAAKARELSKLMRAVGPDPEAACADSLSQKFRLQELEPWQTWQPPAASAAHAS